MWAQWGKEGWGEVREQHGDACYPMGATERVFLELIHVDAWQKPTQYCKAIILQLKINKFKKKISSMDGADCPREKCQINNTF